jgi:serine/threonine protein kinase
MPTPMLEVWDRFEGLSIAGKYSLRRLLESGEESALFLAGGEGEERIAVRLVRDSAGEATAQAALWRRIASLPHPNLVRILGAGELEVDGILVAWAAMEHPEENLGEVLYDRALTAEEARHALVATTAALAHLHAHGLAHGAINPWSVVAVGETVKISAAGAYEAGPEGIAADVRALGLTACEMLTRRVPEVADGTPQLSPEDREAVAPLEIFIRRCLTGDSTARLLAYLRGEPEPPAMPKPKPVRDAAPRPALRIPHWAYWAAGFLVVLAVLLVVAGGGRSSVPEPPPIPAAAPPPVEMPEPRPSPFESAARPSNADEQWRVIVYTYVQSEAAEKSARDINRRFPEFQAEVFAPRGNRPPYLVSLGGRMSRDAAVELQQAARAKGLPRDTYVQNYTR